MESTNTDETIGTPLKAKEATTERRLRKGLLIVCGLMLSTVASLVGAVLSTAVSTPQSKRFIWIMVMVATAVTFGACAGTALRRQDVLRDITRRSETPPVP
ncbi:hypothetical protein ACIRPX_45080 [Streptomyces sp. NPDC101225]|uniref:hypothetical protein n=1 Tax=Streptomyces sp. NPDC101225 TaxID=3366135 RepID=UPI003811E274